MPIVNCSDENAWDRYLRDCPVMKAFPHLRPAGIRELPPHPERPRSDSRTYKVAACPRVRVQPLLDELQRTPRTVAGRPFVLEQIHCLSDLGDATVPRDDDAKCAAISLLLEHFDPDAVRIFYLWTDPEEIFAGEGPLAPVPSTDAWDEYSAECTKTDTFFLWASGPLLQVTHVDTGHPDLTLAGRFSVALLAARMHAAAVREDSLEERRPPALRRSQRLAANRLKLLQRP